ncbi:type II restriction endonuclease [Chitinilyticum aquatile]|uniref:type II restriction endonuclease n=1 Tax=Chitinilyticum aquatile TaxID=362520 RepID=UPI00048B7017|nr:type II restriction endonuclease [Chitinilyticum aquatile]
MFNDQLSDYFEGVAAKYLSRVDAIDAGSNQHEIGGLPKAGFKAHLGQPGKDSEFRFPARQVYIRGLDEEPVIAANPVTWYDCRRKQPHRGPEYRLYYFDNPVTAQLAPGDFFLIAKMRDGTLLMVFTPAGSPIEYQLRALFGLDEVGEQFRAGRLDAVNLLLPLRWMLEQLGIEVDRPETTDEEWLERLLKIFGANQFPGTSHFSAYARNTMPIEIDPFKQPDDALLGWMDHEEKLFRIYERYLVRQKLRAGFGEHGDDVDEFIAFSLSVQNRRKSRVGHAFEGHLDHLFKLHGLKFEQGRGKGKVTENNAKPDFLFPDFASYHNPDFPAARLAMLGAKTTCKDRWRQVLSEAARIPRKHLITLEPAISEAQTMEMNSHGVQLIVPEAIQRTYKPAQREKLKDVAGLITECKLL